MGQKRLEEVVVQTAIDDMIDILNRYSEDGRMAPIGVNFLNHRFSKVPEEHRKEVYFCFETYIANITRPRYDA